MRKSVAWVDEITPDSLDRDPYPVYARLREEAPVSWVPWAGTWFATTWDACSEIGSDAEAFAGAAHHPTLNPVFGTPNVLTANGAEHEDLRLSIDPPLRPRAVNSYIDELARPIVREHLDRIVGRGEAELMSSFFEPLSVRALGDLLGLGVEDEVLRRWFHDLNVGISNVERDPGKRAVADAATEDIERRLSARLAQLRDHPDETMLSHMLHGGRPAGDPRPLDLVLPSLKVILLGGMQEPGHAAASTLLGLAERPEQLGRVAANPSLVTDAIHEGMRWIAPIGAVERQAVDDVRIGEAEIAAGEVIVVILASANRDAARYSDPDAFDLDRPRQTHMAFGNGEHFCSGHYFSRQLERIALEELIPALPGLRLDPEQAPVVTGWNFRAPKKLYMQWDL